MQQHLLYWGWGVLKGEGWWREKNFIREEHYYMRGLAQIVYYFTALVDANCNATESAVLLASCVGINLC